MKYVRDSRAIPWKARRKRKQRRNLILLLSIVVVIGLYFLFAYKNSIGDNIVGNWVTVDGKGNITFTTDTYRINGISTIQDSSGEYKVSKDIVYLYKNFGVQSTDYIISFTGKDKLKLTEANNAIVLEFNRLN